MQLWPKSTPTSWGYKRRTLSVIWKNVLHKALRPIWHLSIDVMVNIAKRNCIHPSFFSIWVQTTVRWRKCCAFGVIGRKRCTFSRGAPEKARTYHLLHMQLSFRTKSLQSYVIHILSIQCLIIYLLAAGTHLNIQNSKSTKTYNPKTKNKLKTGN